MEILNKEESAVAEYRPFYAQLVELEQKNATLVFDYESPKGNKEARSHVNSLRLTKGALERTRKAAKEESLRIGRAIDAEEKEINARIEAMITVHQTAIDAIEQRAEAAERERVEREAAIARAAEERALAEAARAAQEAEARAAAEREAAARRELELKLQAEQAERPRIEAEQRAEQERVDSEARAKRMEQEAKERAERQAAIAEEHARRQAIEAVEAEKARVAAAEIAAAAEQARRERDKKHKAAINRAALAALVAGGLSEDCAKQCVTLIASGKVPAVSINY